MKAHFLTFCVLVAYSNIAQADTIETMRMYDKSLSNILVEAARKDTDEFKRKILNVVILRCKRIVILKECYHLTNIGIG